MCCFCCWQLGAHPLSQYPFLKTNKDLLVLVSEVYTAYIALNMNNISLNRYLLVYYEFRTLFFSVKIQSQKHTQNRTGVRYFEWNLYFDELQVAPFSLLKTPRILIMNHALIEEIIFPLLELHF